MSFGDSRNTGFGGSSGGGDGFGQGGRGRRDDDRRDQFRGYEERGDGGMRSAQPRDNSNRFSGRGDSRDGGGYDFRGRNENNGGSYERNGPRGNFDENRREGQRRPNFDDRNGFGGGRTNEVNRAGELNDGNFRGGDGRGGNGFGNHSLRSGDDQGNRGGLGNRSQGGSNFGGNDRRDFQANHQRNDDYGRGDNEPRREERSQISNNFGFDSRPGLNSQREERRPEAERPRFNENADNMRSGNDGRRPGMVVTNSMSRYRDNNDRGNHSSANYGGSRSNFNNAGDAGGSSRNYDRNDGNNSRGDGFGNDSGGSIFKPSPFIRDDDGMGNFRGGDNSGFGNRPSYNSGVDKNRSNDGRKVNEGAFNRSRSNFDGENNQASNYGQRDGNRFGRDSNNMRRMTYERNQGGFGGSNNNGGNFGGRRGYNSNYGGEEDENSGLNRFSERNFYVNNERPAKERPPKDWLPTEFTVEELYIEDKSQVNTYNETDLDEVQVEGAPDQRFNSWANSGLDEHLIDILVNRRNFPTPRPIQSATIPQVLQGKDVITKAETGSGKTLAFVLPIIDSILKDPRNSRDRSSPLAVILEPTRELADQVYRDFQRMTDETAVKVVLNYGDIQKTTVLQNLTNVDIYVGTVGRFKDYLENNLISLHQLKFFVLDEADQMLKTDKMDELAQVFNSELFSCSDSSRQTMLYSATMNPDAYEMANKLMKKDKIVTISTSGSRANKHIKQVYVPIKANHEKIKHLEKMFEKDKEEGKTVKTLIFVTTRKLSDLLAMQLTSVLNIRAESINGDRPQHMRSEAMNKFRRGEVGILVGTDVASRGHDIPQLDRVVLFDIPSRTSDLEEGLNNLAHRIGRTGRAREGTAIIFIDRSVTPSIAQGLVQMAREVKQEPPEFLKGLANGRSIEDFSFEELAGFGEKKKETSASSLDKKKEEKEVAFGGKFGFGIGRGASTGFGVKKEGTPATSLDKKKEEEEATPGGSSSAFGKVGFGGSSSTSDEEEEENQPTASSFGNVGFGKGSTSEEKKKKEESKSGFGTGFHRREEEATSSSNSDEEEDEEKTEEEATKKEKKPAEKARSSSPDY